MEHGWLYDVLVRSFRLCADRRYHFYSAGDDSGVAFGFWMRWDGSGLVQRTGHGSILLTDMGVAMRRVIFDYVQQHRPPSVEPVEGGDGLTWAGDGWHIQCKGSAPFGYFQAWSHGQVNEGDAAAAMEHARYCADDLNHQLELAALGGDAK